MDKEEAALVTQARRATKTLRVFKDVDVVTLDMTPQEAWSLRKLLEVALTKVDPGYALSGVGRSRLKRILDALHTCDLEM